MPEFVEAAGFARIRAGTVADLLDRWLQTSAPRWSPNTTRENRSIVDHHLRPLLGHPRVDKVTTADVYDLYRHSWSAARRMVSRWRVGRLHGVMGCCTVRSLRRWATSQHPSFPATRPPPFHGHRDARQRDSSTDGVSTSTPTASPVPTARPPRLQRRRGRERGASGQPVLPSSPRQA